MKNTGCCPKCQSIDVLKINGANKLGDKHNYIRIGVTIFSRIRVVRYFCVASGFPEEWVESEQNWLKLKNDLAG